jgi:integrase
MGIFRRKRIVTGPDGQSVIGKDGKPLVRDSSCWYGDVRTATGRRERVNLGPNRRKAKEELGARQNRRRLELSGLVKPDQLADTRKLEKHLTDWETSLVARNAGPEHIELSLGRVRAIVEACGFQKPADIEQTKVEAWIKDRHDAGAGMSTIHHNIGGLKRFCLWMVRCERLPRNPLDGLKVTVTERDLRKNRRALTVAEAEKLLAAAETGKTIFDLTGKERRLIYALALGTGLRRGEIAGLTWADLDLKGPNPTIVVRAAYSKHKRTDTLPLRADLARALADWERQQPIITLKPGLERSPAKVFSLTTSRTAEMITHDLKWAEVRFKDIKGRTDVDFHSLRHTYGTWLAEAGVSLQRVQVLMRHGTPGLTMKYTHLLPEEQRPSVEALPGIVEAPRAEAVELRATGTQGAEVGAEGAEGWTTNGQHFPRLRGSKEPQKPQKAHKMAPVGAVAPTSNPVRGCQRSRGGFDSPPLPPVRPR